MSFVGPLSGALVAGGVYYGFSNLIHTRTEQHRKDLHLLSVRLVETPNLVQAPPSAATRVQPHPLSTEVKAQWNREVENLFRGFQNLDKSVVDWGRSLLYGTSSQEMVEPKQTTGS
ncbi:hypothetical protein CPB83DRAFT_761943 [Crepidotus variabilis]|uniref:MICOS complex subunit MIC12 n=1 Tax=Crepidotus variabilis TaxID=179855 RepID=A0A9P6EL45_9AGAR|nr:hypothetical protein CPB83DRAFT_761943 [Crepidotus variabilis]